MPTKNRRRRPFFRRKKTSLNGEEVSTWRRERGARIKKMKKGIFILPSLLTLMSIFCSFSSIVLAIKGQYMIAAILIVAAGFFDGIDGPVARLTKTATRFGLELDSLADVISFGVAPALLIYMWGLDSYGRLGWVTAFVFVACGALRLARFNVQSGVVDPKRFNGLPIPAAAIMISTTVLFFNDLDLDPSDYVIPLVVLSYLLSFLMVSSIKFHAFKNLTLVKEKPFSSTVAFVLFLALISAQPFLVPFFICLGYVVSGPCLTLVLYLRKKKAVDEKAPEAEADVTP